MLDARFERLSRFLSDPANEGRRTRVYPDSGGVWTVGVGHVVKRADKLHPFSARTEISEAEIDELLRRDIAVAWAAVESLAPGINDNQFVALCSLVFNIGVTAFAKSTLLRKLKAGDTSGAAEQFLRWCYDNGKMVRGLLFRRKREQDLFLKEMS